MNILVTGGTVFVSRYTAQYFLQRGHRVFVLNRNHLPQEAGTTLIEGDRHHLDGRLKPYHFDAVLDITAYTRQDVEALHRALGSFDSYILVSSSAVYPETLPQPFREEQPCGPNVYWGEYGTGKIGAEAYVREHIPQAYILRPPYLYGCMNNLYREAFVFDCAEKDRAFYVPKDGKMPLQFFDVEDLCRIMECLIEKKPPERVFNVGNPETVDICQWVTLCYQVLGKTPRLHYVKENVPRHDYFPFRDYGYCLEVGRQKLLLPDTKPLFRGLEESYVWYQSHRGLVAKKPYMEFIDAHLI